MRQQVKEGTRSMNSTFVGDGALSAAVRAFAMNAGDMSLTIQSEVTRIMNQQGNSQVKAVRVGIDHLLKESYISPREAADLKAICNHVFGSTRAGADISKAASQVQQLYRNMTVSMKSSSAALAIASAACAQLNAAHTDEKTIGPKTLLISVSGTPGARAGAIIGGVLGAVFGGLGGGLLGAGIGGAIGTGVGAAVGYCNDKGI